MNTQASSSGIRPRRAGVVRFALAGALSVTAFFILCWAGAFLPIGPATHMYIQLFTNAEMTSALALVQGICWSIAFGLIAGALVAAAYNATAFLDRE